MSPNGTSEEVISLLLKRIKENPLPVIYARLTTLAVSLVPIQNFRGQSYSAWRPGREIYKSFYFISPSEPVYHEFITTKKLIPPETLPIKQFISPLIPFDNTIVGWLVIYLCGPIMVLLMLFYFINWRKAPITALLNVSTLLYLGVLTLINIAAGGFYHYGGWVLSIISILLFVVEKNFRLNQMHENKKTGTAFQN